MAQLQKWQPIESCLFAIRSISRYIPRDENLVLPHVMALLVQLPPTHLLRNTCCDVIGRYADWLSVNPDHVEPLVRLLIECLSVSLCASHAAVAIRDLCEKPGALSSVGGPMSMLQLYQHLAANSSAVALQDELQVLEGVCKVLSKGSCETSNTNNTPEISYDSFANILVTVVGPVGQRLEGLLAPDKTGTNPKQVMGEIERITAVVRYADPPPPPPGSQHLIVQLMMQSMPLLESASARFGRDFNIVEKICRCYKHALRNCGVSFAPLLESLLRTLLKNFADSFMSPYLYAASICITEFGSHVSCAQMLFYVTTELSNTAFQRFKTLDDFTSHPDVVEEYFYFMGRAISHCPVDLVRSPLLNSVFQCAVVGMQVEHREAHKGILVFLETSITLAVDALSRDQKWSTNVRASCAEPLQAVIIAEAAAVVHALVRALTGDLPSYSLDSGSGSLAGILWKLNILCPKLLQEWVAGSMISLSVREAAANTLIGALRSHARREVFNGAVRQFVNFCDRERKLCRKVN
mmetsp:Transcript_24213/g.55109  ORF Transcript_24213/g.55109 Transcript_24213/m.55109 type:complete len:523 (+) Transcript_24213:4205-5773(+)|eukprot:CAMPEP_0113330994 /NCGR_PEP_ID=MMETSP0010_2-20120614/22164_1 /TAXON_ID=216773 ORGANISM="Corethron hystrix, Strain 308" /NCGR_SAMPLE_ID=MMETSP0010_2 /ASSEMBLY_ACC=CAM_ASM_000155 /LENGTH=522 /DNA_ID=CAMNT_0000194055 /DNA_START=1365 /DNA_END=2933 /DNA_ORIENTATION=+ /assembly_acc=CAM_ASM_000155